MDGTLAFEEAFDIDVSDEESARIRTVRGRDRLRRA